MSEGEGAEETKREHRVRVRVRVRVTHLAVAVGVWSGLRILRVGSCLVVVVCSWGLGLWVQG